MVIAAAGIAAAGTVAASSIGGSKQAGAVKDAQASADATQRAMYDQTRQDQLPWLQHGQVALNQLSQLQGLQGPDAAQAAGAAFTASPGYAFQLEQGLRAVDQGAAARGMLRSGATLAAEQALGSNLAAQEYGAYVNRLAALAQVGQTAANALGQSGTVAGQGIAQTAASGGAALASIYGNQASGIGNALNNGLQNTLYANRLNGLSNLGGDPFSGPGTTSLYPGGF